MNPYLWNEHLLLVTFAAGRDNVVFLLDHATQEQFFARAITFSHMPAVLNVEKLTEEAFDILVPQFESRDRLIEGE